MCSRAEAAAAGRGFDGKPAAGDAFGHRRRGQHLFKEGDERGAVEEMGPADQVQAADELHQGLGGSAPDLEEPLDVGSAPGLAGGGCDPGHSGDGPEEFDAGLA